jgi:hypothetical protein
MARVISTFSRQRATRNSNPAGHDASPHVARRAQVHVSSAFSDSLVPFLDDKLNSAM